LVGLAPKVMAEAPTTGPVMDGSATVKDYLRLKVGDSERELFGCLFLTMRHEVLSDQVLFHGTIDRTKVYPREILKRIFAVNAAAVIVYHTHRLRQPATMGGPGFIPNLGVQRPRLARRRRQGSGDGALVSGVQRASGDPPTSIDAAGREPDGHQPRTPRASAGGDGHDGTGSAVARRARYGVSTFRRGPSDGLGTGRTSEEKLN